MGIYKGDSTSFRYLEEGYIDYAREVVSNRSIPNLVDGLKPVNRRIVYVMNKEKFYHSKPEILSIKIVGLVNSYHTHGDASVYSSLVRMTDTNGTLNIPLVHGKGNWGFVGSDDEPGAPRYTKANLTPYGEDIYKDEPIMVPGEADYNTPEPLYLPTKFPLVLVNGSAGIAVSVATKIPSFNLYDVLDLTEKYIRNGELGPGDIIYPDFPLGGQFVEDRGTAYRIMRSGKGSFTVRAKTIIQGNDIVVTELPFGTTVEKIHAKVQSIIDDGTLPIKEVVKVLDYSRDSYLRIMCKARSNPEDVLIHLYRMGILQVKSYANIAVMHEDSFHMLGVHGIVEEWGKWRREFSTMRLTEQLDSLNEQIQRASYFIDLIDNEERKQEYLQVATQQGKYEAGKLLKSYYDTIPDDVVAWIGSRTVNDFHRGGAYRTRYEGLLASKKVVEADLNDIDGSIIRMLNEVRGSYKGFERRTEIVREVYKFTRVSEDKPVEADSSVCTWELSNDGFLSKRFGVSNEEGTRIVNAPANATMVMFDATGRVLKVFGEDIPSTEYNEVGTNVATYCGIEDPVPILYMSEADTTEKILLYNDGKASFYTPTDFISSVKRRVNAKGVPSDVGSTLTEIIDVAPDTYFMFLDNGTRRVRFGWVNLDDVRRPASTTTKSRIVTGSGINIQFCGTVPAGEFDMPAWAYDYEGRIRGVDVDELDEVGILEVLDEPSFARAD